VVIPAWNESARIAATVSAAFACPLVASVVVVDDGSSDATAQQARDAGAEVVVPPTRGGKARAIVAGLERVRTPITALLDADLGASASCLTELAEPVVAGRAEAAIADMPFDGGRRGLGLVTALSRWAVRRFGGLVLDNPICGQRVMLTEVARQVLIPPARGFAVEIRSTIILGRLGKRVEVVAVPMAHRRTRYDLRGLVHRWRQFRDVLVEVVRWVLGRG
jgi:glycosyltransferase involved in cell wall biosynthesis